MHREVAAGGEGDELLCALFAGLPNLPGDEPLLQYTVSLSSAFPVAATGAHTHISTASKHDESQVNMPKHTALPLCLCPGMQKMVMC